MKEFREGDIVEIAGWEAGYNGVMFEVGGVRPHPTEDGDFLVSVPEKTVNEWKADIDKPWMYLEEEGVIEFWSGFLKNLGPSQLEND